VPVPLPHDSLPKLHLKYVGEEHGGLMMRDAVTGTGVIQFPEDYSKQLTSVQWDGQYLITGYKSGKVAILEFTNFVV